MAQDIRQKVAYRYWPEYAQKTHTPFGKFLDTKVNVGKLTVPAGVLTVLGCFVAGALTGGVAGLVAGVAIGAGSIAGLMMALVVDHEVAVKRAEKELRADIESGALIKRYADEYVPARMANLDNASKNVAEVAARYRSEYAQKTYTNIGRGLNTETISVKAPARTVIILGRNLEISKVDFEIPGPATLVILGCAVVGILAGGFVGLAIGAAFGAVGVGLATAVERHVSLGRAETALQADVASGTLVNRYAEEQAAQISQAKAQLETDKAAALALLSAKGDFKMVAAPVTVEQAKEFVASVELPEPPQKPDAPAA